MQITNKIYVIIALHYWRKYTISVETDKQTTIANDYTTYYVVKSNLNKKNTLNNDDLHFFLQHPWIKRSFTCVDILNAKLILIISDLSCMC
jgi:hypothetical protein